MQDTMEIHISFKWVPCQVEAECKQEPEESENNNFGNITESQAQLLV